ncbi:MAG TPA: alpha/beta hydrolase [Abditibacteriaceae bacterium]|jgi:acetyl esterase
MFEKKHFAVAVVVAAAFAAPKIHAAPNVPMKMGNTTIRVDAQQKRVLDELTTFNSPPVRFLTPHNARNLPSPTTAVMSLLSKRSKPVFEPVGDVSHLVIRTPDGRQILSRVYRPRGMAKAKNLPVLMYFHGGGFVFANLDTYDPSCRALSNAAKAMVISVAYRQAPENPFPAAPEDAYAATQWAMNNIQNHGGDPRRVAVSGESAGGNLATVVCLMARDRRGKMPVHQLLVYPVTTWETSDQPSVVKYAKAKPLDTPMLAWFRGHYLKNPNDINNPYASPLKANLRGLPAATVVAAEIDPLQSQGIQYVVKLRSAGVPVEYRLYRNVAHEFFGQGAVVAKAKQAVAFSAARLKMAYRK